MILLKFSLRRDRIGLVLRASLKQEELRTVSFQMETHGFEWRRSDAYISF